MRRAPILSAQNASAGGQRLARLKTDTKTNVGLDKKRFATHRVVTITAKSVKLTLVASEPGQAARRQKKMAISREKGRKVRGVRLASNS
jgi:hypothetical protein